jgi:hypothetical protein
MNAAHAGSETGFSQLESVDVIHICVWGVLLRPLQPIICSAARLLLHFRHSTERTHPSKAAKRFTSRAPPFSGSQVSLGLQCSWALSTSNSSLFLSDIPIRILCDISHIPPARRWKWYSANLIFVVIIDLILIYGHLFWEYTCICNFRKYTPIRLNGIVRN